jgi:cytochrome c oxidase subunit III
MAADSHGHQEHAHHFDSIEHEFEAGKLGMWLFLVTEVMLFGGLFVAFGIYQYMFPEMYKEAHHHLDRVMGSINTVVLLSSSLTMALAIAYVQRGKRDLAKWMLWLTLACAAMFLVIKYFEYSHKIHDGLLPGKFFTNTEFKAPNAALFFSLYFVMTGLHGIHVLIGMGAILWILKRLYSGDFNEHNYGAVEFTGLYWHIVDLIWIFLFPLLYLVT